MHQTPQANYDEVPYPSEVQARTDPDRLATIAALLGLEAASTEHCRVLELGCGDGTNLLAMACRSPKCEFLGIDSAARPVAEGNRIIAELGLANIRLEQRDLLEFSARAGTFDYIITHGVYSWVPAPVRNRILAICAECLAPNGIAYISYNVYPGCHLRDMVRNMMLFHVRNIEDAGQKIIQSRLLLQFLTSSKTEPDLYRKMLKEESDLAENRSDGAFFHDELNPVNEPVYFHQFVEHAAQHGLQFLSETAFTAIDSSKFTLATAEMIRELDADPIAREQYLDFLLCRRFRRTLLCRKEIPIDHKIRPGVIRNLFVASHAQAVSGKPDLESLEPEVFRTPGGAAIETSSSLHKAALWHLSQRWPEAISFAELLSLSTDSDTDDEDEAATELCNLLLRTFVGGVIELHVVRPPVVTSVSARPIASALARLESRGKPCVSTLRHSELELKDPLNRHLLGLLDGTRDHAALAENLLAFVQTGGADVIRDGKPVTDPVRLRAIIEEGLPFALEMFARAAVLVG